MKPTLLLPPTPDDSWTLAVQAGVRYAVTKPTAALSGLPSPEQPGVLATLQRRFADHGLTLIGLEGDPFDMAPIKLGLPRRDETLDRYRQLLQRMRELGLDLLCYNFMLRLPGATHDWSRTRTDHPTRGGALTTAFSFDDVPSAVAEPTHDTVWSNYQHFITAVIPDAEAAGVRMALHPDDPPLPILAGVPRLFGSIDAFHRAYALAPSPANAVTFCQANFTLMPGNPTEHARQLADRIAFVHWRDVVGTPQDFHETFHDDGPSDMAAWVRLYAELGFTGPIRMDHAPLLSGEPQPWMPGYGTTGRLLAIAYLRGMLRGLSIAEA
ncbi:MAG: mannonate dehydratase [Planctomycetota bacterium]